MPRTILVAGGYPHHLPAAVVRAFAHAGWRAEFFDLSPESPFHDPFVKPVRKLIHGLRIQRHPETFDDTFLSNLGWRSRGWLKLVRKLRPDAALLLRGNRIALPALQRAAAEGVPLFCWMLENETRLASFLAEARAGVYRKIFVYAQSYLRELEQIGQHGTYHPHRAAELPDESRIVNRARRHQWSFLGSHSTWREKVLTALLEEFPGGFLVGPRWDRFKSRPRFREVVGGGYFQQKESTELYLDSRVGLDICAQEEPGVSGVAMRVPELIACGCRVLLQDMVELRALPYASTSFATWRTIDELLALMRRELSGDPLAPAQALAAARSVVGYENLVGQVTAALESSR
jgi:hypothetical protein